MRNTLFLIVCLIIGVGSMAVSKDDIENLEFEKGLDDYQTIAVIDALSEDIEDVFSIYLKECKYYS